MGAVQLLPLDEQPTGFNRIDGEVLDEESVATFLRNTVTTGQFGHQGKEQDLRISIAGAQEKTALLRHGGQMVEAARCHTHHAHPQAALGLVGNMQADMRTSVYNEWLCLKLMGALRFEVANADIVTFADHPPVLAVERFDRRMHPSGTWLLRLPQEDFCQALGVTPPKVRSRRWSRH